MECAERDIVVCVDISLVHSSPPVHVVHHPPHVRRGLLQEGRRFILPIEAMEMFDAGRSTASRSTHAHPLGSSPVGLRSAQVEVGGKDRQQHRSVPVRAQQHGTSPSEDVHGPQVDLDLLSH